MKLVKLLEHLEYEVVQGTEEKDVKGITDHSKKTGKDFVFICIEGSVTDGNLYIEEAVKNGASVIVTERKFKIPFLSTCIYVKDAREALALMSAAYYDYPAEKLKVIGITGTAGKTTTACVIHDILEKSGCKSGLVGTIEVQTGKRKIPVINTSPESIYIHRYFKEMVEAGCKTVVMEVSSQALKLKRVFGIVFDLAVFTNIGNDHISEKEHQNFREYKNCKQKLFCQCRTAVVNSDDLFWKDMVSKKGCQVITTGMNEQADYCFYNIKNERKDKKLGIKYEVKGKFNGIIKTSLPGKFNAYNTMLAFAVCDFYKIDRSIIKETLKDIKVKGRTEMIYLPQNIPVMIDYAHNAMSLQSILEMVHSYSPKRIVCIFGCGGNRSLDRRYEMGRVSGRLSDLTILTSDNPREEEVSKIISDIEKGIQKTKGEYLKIPDRKEALFYAVSNAKEGDIIIVAGKGHETYQEIKGIKYHLDDKEIIQKIIEKEQEDVRRHYC